jgi:hypothetical protein
LEGHKDLGFPWVPLPLSLLPIVPMVLFSLLPVAIKVAAKLEILSVAENLILEILESL